MRDYHDNRLDGGGRGAALGALATLVVGMLTVAAMVYIGDDDDKDSSGKPAASATPNAGQSSAAAKPQEQEPQATSPTPPTRAPAASYKSVYKDRKVGISFAGFDAGTLDLDRPRAQVFQSGDYQDMQEEAQAEGTLLEPDLLYTADMAAELSIVEGRTAVHTESPPPAQPEQCAADAEAGGFDAIEMYEWPLEVGSGFCLITDQGNVVRLQITRFVGGDRSLSRNPDRIEFSATMWRPSES
ncbi:hypothetical protein ACFY4K_34775 [Streptomyces leeuwenhoekii]|uniref:hypothetical protein n=1 Tax=Streptomyces leeuwenhoekii TaxID=1437453 RepID=UPI0036BCCB27